MVKINYLLEDCRRFGTLPLHLARSSFVALTLLKDAVSAGVISNLALEVFFPLFPLLVMIFI